MTLPCNTADVLSDHVLLEIESVDRMYLSVCQPRLQYGGGVAVARRSAGPNNLTTLTLRTFRFCRSLHEATDWISARKCHVPRLHCQAWTNRPAGTTLPSGSPGMTTSPRSSHPAGERTQPVSGRCPRSCGGA